MCSLSTFAITHQEGYVLTEQADLFVDMLAKILELAVAASGERRGYPRHQL